MGTNLAVSGQTVRDSGGFKPGGRVELAQDVRDVLGPGQELPARFVRGNDEVSPGGREVAAAAHSIMVPFSH